MNKKLFYISILLTGISLLLCGCSISEPIQISPGVYSIYQQDRAGIFGNPSKMRSDVISKANSFAATRGMVAAPIASSFTPMGLGPAQFASFEYRFYILQPTQYAEIQRKIKRDWYALSPAQRLTYEQRARALALAQQSINQAANAQNQDVYIRQQQINAYQQRTQTLNQPFNMNVTGTINHNVNSSGVPLLYGY